jgi:hypothetical protein
LLPLGAAWAAAASAQDAAEPVPAAGGPEWMLAVSALTDEQSFEHAIAGFYLGIRDDTWLSLAAGRSRAPSTEEDIRAGLVSVGIEHDFGPLGVGLTTERWGDSNDLESRDWRGEIFFGGERYRVALAYESRAIDVYLSGAGLLVTDPRRVPIDADGLGINWRVRLAPAWRAYGSWFDFDYPRRVHLVPRVDRLDLLSSSAVTLAYSLTDRYEMIGFERSLGRKLVGFDFSRDQSAIDGAIYRSLAASVLWPVAERMDLEFRLGSSRVDGQGSSVYGGLTLLVYRGG